MYCIYVCIVVPRWLYRISVSGSNCRDVCIFVSSKSDHIASWCCFTAVLSLLPLFASFFLTPRLPPPISQVPFWSRWWLSTAGWTLYPSRLRRLWATLPRQNTSRRCGVACGCHFYSVAGADADASHFTTRCTVSCKTHTVYAKIVGVYTVHCFFCIYM